MQEAIMANTPTRIDDDLFAAAKATGAVLSRSAAQQVNHWARVGRQLEESAVLSTRDIEQVLTGEKQYDEVGGYEQAVVRAEWEAQLADLAGGVDLTAEVGDTWVEADLKGRPVRRSVGSAPRKRTPRAG